MVDNASFRESQFKKTVDLVFVGRILRSKGIFVLAEALENISEMGIKLKVVIVGDGVDLASLRAHLDPLDSIDVSYAGVQIGKGLASILAQSRILVFPSTTHPEGMGLVAAEAMMFAVPVIGADQPAIREVVGDAGIMTRLGDSFSLSTAVTNVLSNEALQKRLSISALERSKSFLLPEFNEKLASIFTKIDSQ
ncbi:MAG: glycosyltransferase family 4 protein [Cyanobacteria bacterium J06634_5]